MPDAATPVPADAAVDATAPGGTPPPEGRRTELRLALVCYGGVSLAVYMHGITKELHKLVIASRRFDEAEPGINGAAAFPEPGADTEHVYFDLLGELADRGQRLSVTVDIIAGTSAGGINGVCLGKVIAGNGSQDALKRLWLEESDLTRLLNAPRLGSWRLQAVTATLL